MRFFLETDHPDYPIVEIQAYFYSGWKSIVPQNLGVKKNKLWDISNKDTVYAFQGVGQSGYEWINLKENKIKQFWSEEW